MAVSAECVPVAVIRVKDTLSEFCNLLTQTLHLTRRCSEGFKKKYQEWLQLRVDIIKGITRLRDNLRRLNSDQWYGKILQNSLQLLEDLRLDYDIVQELLTIFNEYLSYISKVKLAVEETKSTRLPQRILDLVQKELPEFCQTLEHAQYLSSTDLNIFDMVSVLKYMNSISLGGEAVFQKMIEHLSFLTFHWDIILELSFLEANKGPVYDVNTFLDRFPKDTEIEDKRASYYDVISNLTVSSAAFAVVSTVVNSDVEELQAESETLCKKLTKVELAMNDRTERIELIIELLVAET